MIGYYKTYHCTSWRLEESHIHDPDTETATGMSLRRVCCVWLILLSGMICSTTGSSNAPSSAAGCTNAPKSNTNAQNMGIEILGKCSYQYIPTYNYYGPMFSDGISTMISNDWSTDHKFYLFESSAFSHLAQRFKQDHNTVCGIFYNYVEGTSDKGCVVIYSLETGGGDTFLYVYMNMQPPPPDLAMQYYDFKPSCGLHTPNIFYNGPYIHVTSYGQVYPFTCIYRTITMGHPVTCYTDVCMGKGCEYVDSQLTENTVFKLMATSLPTKSSSHKFYDMAYTGTLSVHGYGSYEVPNPGISIEIGDEEKDYGVEQIGDEAKDYGVGQIGDQEYGVGHGTFEGIMYVTKDDNNVRVVVVEGWVGMHTANDDQSEPTGTFSLKTWELVQIAPEGDALMKTVHSLKPLPSTTYSWTCSSVTDDQYHFNVKNCNKPAQQMWDVYWLGIWTQYSQNYEDSPTGCWPAYHAFSTANDLLMVPNGYDVLIRATVVYQSNVPKITYTLYGDGCGDDACAGPAMMVGCERAANHGSMTPWGDLGVGDTTENVWLSDKMSFMGATPYMGYAETTGVVAKWEEGKVVAQNNMEMARYFNSKSRIVQGVGYINGNYPDRVEKNVIYEGMSGAKVNSQSNLAFPLQPWYSGNSLIEDAPFTIICVVPVTCDCLINVKPSCNVGYLDKDGTVEARFVQAIFPADMFIDLDVGLDSLGVAKYRAQVTLVNPSGDLIGVPTDVNGLIIPTDGSGSNSASESAANVRAPGCGQCQQNAQAIITILTLGVPLLTGCLLHFFHAVDDSTMAGIVSVEVAILLVAFLYIWWQNPTNRDTVMNRLRRLGITITCTWIGCCPRDDPSRMPFPVDRQVLYGAVSTTLIMSQQAAADSSDTIVCDDIDVDYLKSSNPSASPAFCFLYLTMTDTAPTLDPSATYIACENGAMVSLRPVIGYQRKIEDIIRIGQATSVSFYGWGWQRIYTGPSTTKYSQVGVVCKMPVQIDKTESVIKIQGGCYLSVNGEVPDPTAIISVFSPFLTTNDFPMKT